MNEKWTEFSENVEMMQVVSTYSSAYTDPFFFSQMVTYITDSVSVHRIDGTSIRL